MVLGKDELYTDGHNYLASWVETLPVTELDEYGDEVEVVYDDGRPVVELWYHTKSFGTTDNRKAAIAAFREWHKRREHEGRQT